MWIAELLRNVSGIGTELGAFNLLVLVALAFFLRRRVQILKDKEKQHDQMFEDYRQRRKSSGAHTFSDRELMAGMVSEILKGKDDAE
jgi:hypothetical protein